MKKNIAIFFLNAFLIACFFFIIKQSSEYKESISFRSKNSFAVVQFDKLSQKNEDTKFQSYTAHKNAGIKTAIGKLNNIKGKHSNKSSNSEDAVFESLPTNLLDQSNRKSITVKSSKDNQNGYNYTYFGRKIEDGIPSNAGGSGYADNYNSSAKSMNIMGQGNYNYSFARSLAYNSLSSPKLTLDNNLNDEDPFNPGNGNDNDSFYNDVPVGDGTVIMLIMLMIFVGWKRRKLIHN